MDGWIPTTEALGGININNLKVTSSLMLFAVIDVGFFKRIFNEGMDGFNSKNIRI